MGKLPSQPKFTPKENCQAITLRNGKEVENVASKGKKVIDDDDKVVEVETSKGDDNVIISGKDDVESVKKS